MFKTLDIRLLTKIWGGGDDVITHIDYRKLSRERFQAKANRQTL